MDRDIAPLDVVSVHRIEWGEWKLHGSGTSGYNDTCMGGTSHSLEETGNNTSGCRYSVRHNGVTLLKVMFKPPCCMMELRCPIGKCGLPLTTCRKRLREVVIGAAHQGWAQYLRTLAGDGLPLTEANTINRT